MARRSGSRAPASRPADSGARPSRAPEPIAWPAAALVLLLAAVVLLGHAFLYSFVLGSARHAFFSDDALISLRYAQRFVHGLGLTWNGGEPPVEGYSNLLWVLLLAGLGRCGVDLIVAARLLGFLATLATFAAVVHAVPPRRGPGPDAPLRAATVLPALGGTLALALSGPVAIWAIGGLEQALLAALVAWAVVLLFPLCDGGPTSARRVLASGLLLGLAVLTRPDAPLFAAAACVCLAVARRFERRGVAQAATLAALPLLALVGQTLFRHAYYGDWVPNSAHAKLALTAERLRTGLSYTAGGALWLAPLLLGALALTVAMHRAGRGGRAGLLLGVAGLWTLYVVLVGGDILPGRRHLVVVAVLLALLAADGLEALLARTSGRQGMVWAGALGALLALALLQAGDPANRRAREETWEWDGEIVGRMLKTAFGARQPLLAVDPAGCVPYFSGLPAIDMLGINDRYLATHPPQGFGNGWLGHELGDGRYVMERQPDLILFAGSHGRLRPRYRSGEEMFADPRFFATFQAVEFAIAKPWPLQALLWVRGEGGRLGVRRESGRVTVPGYFLVPVGWLARPLEPGRAEPSVSVGSGQLDSTGVIDCLVRGGTRYVMLGQRLEPGNWRVRVDPPAPGLRLEVGIAGASQFQAASDSSACDVTVHAGEAGIAAVLSTRLPQGVHVRQIIIEKVGQR